MRFHPSAIIRLAIPATLIGGAVFAREYVDQLTGESRVIVDNLPYLICVLAGFMAYQFQRCRLLLASVGVAAFYWLVQAHLQVSLSDPVAARLYLVASLALPLLCLFLLLVPERGILSSYGLMMIALSIALAGACFPLADWLQASGGEFAASFTSRPVEGYVLSRGASVLIAGVTLLGVVLLGLRDVEAESTLVGILLALSAALAFLHLDNISVVMSVAASLILVWGVLRSSHAMAYRDELTGLLSRRALNERLNSLGRRYSIAMLDVDHFKKFNDTHGHDVGDEVLRLVASRVKQVGSGGTAYRYGGEEFCIVFPRRSTEECAEALDQVREGIADYRMSIRDRKQRPVKTKDGSRKRGATRVNGSQVSVTVSAGLAARSDELCNPEAVILAADEKLYKAKKSGRNCVVY